MAKVVFVTLYDKYSAGLRIMSSVLRASGHDCSIIYFKLSFNEVIEIPREKPISGEVFNKWELREYANNDIPWTSREAEILLNCLSENNPDIIGFSSRSPFDEVSMELLKKIRNKFPKTLLIAGGYGPMLNPEQYLKNVDYIVFGDGEETILEIANLVDKNEKINNVKNLIHICNNKVKRNQIREPEKNLDKFPLPDYDNPKNCYIDNNKLYRKDPIRLFESPEKISSISYPILIGRGCILDCSYCSAGQLKNLYREYGNHKIKSHRMRSMDHIFSELSLCKKRGYKWISFLESFLQGSKSYMLSFFERYKMEIDLPFTAHLHGRQIVKYPEILDAACKAGFSFGPIGIQHGDEAFCKKYFNRFISNELILEVADMFLSHKVMTEYQFIAGIPFDTEKHLEKSFEFVKKLPMKYASIIVSRLKIYPGSPLEKTIENYNLNKDIMPARWYFEALLYNLRTIFDDDLFNCCLRIVKRLLKEKNTSFLELKHSFFRLLVQELISANETVFCKSNTFMREIYKAYLEEIKQEPILICGDLEKYRDFQDIFFDSNIDAFIAENDLRNKTTIIDKTMIKPYTYLNNKKAPVFICSDDKLKIFKKLKKENPISIIP